MLGIARVAKTLQFCMRKFSIEATIMVKLVHSGTSAGKTFKRKQSFKYKRWGILAGVLLFAGSASFLRYSYFSHNASDSYCNCLICTFNNIPEDSELLYNRYLIFISLIWIAILFGIIFIASYYAQRKHKR